MPRQIYSDYYFHNSISHLFLCSHEKALEAMTMKGEAENRPRFHAIINALKGEHAPATLKVITFCQPYYNLRDMLSSIFTIPLP